MTDDTTTYGMTAKGFVPKKLSQILTDLNTNIANIVDPKSGEFPFQNASDDSILQQVLGVFAEGLSECWEAAYNGSVQFDPLKNSGAGQAGTVQLNAMLVKAGSSTIIEMELLGTRGTTIPKDSLISSSDNLHVFSTMEAVFIGESGKAFVNAECTEQGEVSPEVNTIIAIQTPISGWLNATNTKIVSVGNEQETEAEVRRRQQRSTSLTSYRQIDSIYSAVANISGVTYCRAYQNTQKNPQDERGIPFKEVAVVAEGGDPREIANALFLRFPVGVIGYGNTHEVFYDKQGISHAISFSRPINIPIFVAVDIQLTDRAEFPDTGKDLIAEAILAYAEYGGSGNEDGFPPGSDIILSRLYTPINSVAGHKVTRLVIAQDEVDSKGEEDPVFSENDIAIAWNQVGRFSMSRITVNLVE